MGGYEWRGPGTYPGDNTVISAWNTYNTSQQQAVNDVATAKAKAINIAQSTVGTNITDLTATQIKALIACLLFKSGAIDKNGVVKSLDTWL